MTDDELTEKILGHDVGAARHECFWINHQGLSAHDFVRSWHVAGELIADFTAYQFLRVLGGMGASVRLEPRVVIEAIIAYYE